MWVIIVTVVILYILLILWTNANMYAFEKREKIIAIVSGVLITFLLTVILVLCNGAQVENKSASFSMNLCNILLFSAVNALIGVPTIAKIFNRKKLQELDEKQTRNQLLVRIGIFIIMIMIEISYLQSFQDMITKMLA